MRMKTSFAAFGFVAAFAGIASECVSSGKCEGSSCMSDAKITDVVQTRLDQHPDLGPPHRILVDTHDRVVYLQGKMTTEFERSTASSIAEQVDGVARVVNELAMAN